MNKVDYTPLQKRCPICGAYPVITVSVGARVLGCFIKDMREVKIHCPDCNSAHCATYVCYEDGILDSQNNVLKEWSKWVDEQSIHYGKFDPFIIARCFEFEAKKAEKDIKEELDKLYCHSFYCQTKLPPYFGLLKCGYELEFDGDAFSIFRDNAFNSIKIKVCKKAKTVSKYLSDGFSLIEPMTLQFSIFEEKAIKEYFSELAIAGVKGNHEERKEFKKYDPQMMDGLIKLRDWLMEDLNFFLKSRHSTKERNEYGDLVERFCYSINTSLSILKEREVFKEKYELIYPPLLYNILNELRRYVNSPEIEKKLLDDKDFSMKYADCWIADILYFLKDRETK